MLVRGRSGYVPHLPRKGRFSAIQLFSPLRTAVLMGPASLSLSGEDRPSAIQLSGLLLGEMSQSTLEILMSRFDSPK